MKTPALDHLVPRNRESLITDDQPADLITLISYKLDNISDSRREPSYKKANKNTAINTIEEITRMFPLPEQKQS